MKKHRILALALIVMMLMSSLMACQPQGGGTEKTTVATTTVAATTTTAGAAQTTTVAATTTGAKTEEVVFRFARPEDFKNFDPFNNTDIVNNMSAYLTYDTLVEFDENRNLVPGLAESWTFNDANTEITFKIRKGVKFHNGEDLTAEDVSITFGRLLEPNNTLIAKSIFAGMTGCDAIDDYTVKFTLSSPNGYFMSILAEAKSGAIIPGDLYKKEGEACFQKNIGSGPWKFVSYKPGIEIEYVPNENYWKENPSNVDRIFYMPINEDTTRISAVRTGEVDMIDSVPTDQLGVLESEGLELTKLMSTDQLYIGFQFLNSVFSDYNVRMAFNHAIDRDSIVADILGSGRAATYPCGEGNLGFDPAWPKIEYDVAKAKEYLAKSTYKNEEIRVIGPIGNYEKIDETLSAIYYMLTAVGFNVKLEQLEGAAFGEARRAGKYDAYIVGAAFSGAAGDGYGFLNQRIVGDSLASHYGNEELNKMILDSNAIMDSAKRAEKLKELYAKIMKDAAPMQFILQYQFNYASRKGITGVAFGPNKTPDLSTVRK